MIGISVEDNNLPERLRRTARSVKRPRRPMADLGGHWQRRVKTSMPHLGPMQAAQPGSPPGVHTSAHAHSLLYAVGSDGRSMHLGSSSISARILDKGGTVRARRAKMLAIPISVESYGKRPRDFADLRIGAVYRRGGQAKALLGRGSGDGFEPLFVLQREARILPHPHIRMIHEDWVYFGRALEAELDREFMGT